MGCIALVPCVLVLRCGLAWVVWYPDAGYLLNYFMGCIALVPCVLVLRCGIAGVVWYPDTTPPQPNHNVTPTHIEPEQYNP